MGNTLCSVCVKQRCIMYSMLLQCNAAVSDCNSAEKRAPHYVKYAINARFEAQERPAMQEPESDALAVVPVSILV